MILLSVLSDTPSNVVPLTTYQPQAGPTTISQIDPGQSPSASTVGAAATLSGTTTAVSPTGTVIGTTPSSGLSTGAKAGIGVGVALGVCLLAALAIAFFIRRTHGRREQAQQNPQRAPGPYGPQPPPGQPGPQMQGAPYYNPADKATWQAGGYLFPPSGSHTPAPYYNTNHGSPFHDTPGMSSAGSEIANDVYFKEAPRSPPLELPGEPRAMLHELDSDVAAVSPPPTPTPAYVETKSEVPS